MACFYSAPLAWNPTGVDNRGAQREAVYTITEVAAHALRSL